MNSIYDSIYKKLPENIYLLGVPNILPEPDLSRLWQLCAQLFALLSAQLSTWLSAPGYPRLVIHARLSTPGYPCQVICPVIHPVVHLVIWCFLIWWSSFIKLSDGDLQSKFIQNISYLYLVLTFLCVLFHMIMNYIHTYLRFFAISAGIPVTKSKCWNAKMEQASFYHSYWVKLTCLWWKKKS